MQRKVLLVDDEASLRRTMAIGLSQYGYETESCENGVNALKALETYMAEQIPLAGVVVDIKLPDIDGIKLVKIIKFKYPGIPIVLITGYADRYNHDEIRDLRVGAFLEKPFSPEELSRQFARLMAETQEQGNVVAAPVAEQIPGQQSRSLYALVKLAADCDFFATYRSLYYMDNVLYCDAVKGEYDVFMLIQAENLDDCRRVCETKIKTLDGVASVEILDVIPAKLDDSTASIIETVETALFDESTGALKNREIGHRVCSYVAIEVETGKINQVYPMLRLRDEVVYCDTTKGKFNLVMLVTGHHFTEIDRFIQQRLINTDGILKVKEYPIVNLFEM